MEFVAKAVKSVITQGKLMTLFVTSNEFDPRESTIILQRLGSNDVATLNRKDGPSVDFS